MNRNASEAARDARPQHGAVASERRSGEAHQAVDRPDSRSVFVSREEALDPPPRCAREGLRIVIFNAFPVAHLRLDRGGVRRLAVILI